MMFLKIKLPQYCCHWGNYKLNCKKTEKNNLITSKETTNEVPRNIFRGVEETKMYDSYFEEQTKTWKVNFTVLALINKEITYLQVSK